MGMYKSAHLLESYLFCLLLRCFTSLCYTADGKCVLAGGRSKFVCIYHVQQQVSVASDCRSNTAVSRKVVGKRARDNPERYCGWFCLPCSPKKLKEWHERPRTYAREC